MEAKATIQAEPQAEGAQAAGGAGAPGASEGGGGDEGGAPVTSAESPPPAVAPAAAAPAAAPTAASAAPPEGMVEHAAAVGATVDHSPMDQEQDDGPGPAGELASEGARKAEPESESRRLG